VRPEEGQDFGEAEQNFIAAIDELL